MRLVVRDGDVGIDLADPALRLTPEQQAACATDREIVLSAGAGSGKTHTLSVRYAALQLRQALAGKTDVAAVLVLTFTERAAAEMAERCQERLLELVAAARAARSTIDDQRPGAGTRLVDTLEIIASQADNAAISTFHGFCASTLREFPQHQRAAQYQRVALVLSEVDARRLADRQIDEALDRMVATRPSDLAPLLDAFESRAALVEAARTALERRVPLARALEDHARAGITIETLAARAAPTAEEAQAWTRDVGVAALRILVRLTAPSGGGPLVTETLKPLLDAPEGAPNDRLAIWGRYREVLEALLTDAGRFRALDHPRIFGTRDEWPDAGRFRLAKEAARVLADRLRGDWVARAVAARRLPTAADVVLLDTLAPFARLVLDAAAGLAAELDRTRTTTFDEMQSRAVAAVTNDAAVRATLRERHRYLMVDELQDTDAAQWSLVRVLARQDPTTPEDRLFVVGDPKQAIYSFRGGDVRVFGQATRELGIVPLPLSVNFRSRRGIVEWCNALFPHVFGTDPVAPWEVPYAPMAAASGEPGGDVLLLHGEGLGAARQAAVVADWLVEAQRDRTAPMAVLLRARTHQELFEAALRQRGVPFAVARGMSFWSRREVVDVVLALAAVSRGDPISTVGFLRSPLGGLTDQEVQDGGGRLDGRAAERIAEWRALGREGPPSEVVHAIARAQRAYLAVSDPSGQAEANTRRLVSIVSALDPLGLDAVADRLLDEVDRGSRETEAVVTPGEPRVLLCTIHAAKGLEFPVVIVPQLDARPRRDTGPLRVARLDGDSDWAFATRVSDPESDVQTRVAPGRLAAIDDVLRQEADAEERRLLYVAATRARDTLVLVGSDQPPAEPGSRQTWMQLLLAHLPPSTTVRTIDADPLPQPSALRPLPAESPAAPLPPLPSTPPSITIAASTLDLFATDPDRWVRTAVFGLPEETSLPRRHALALHAARGRAVHQVLERGLVDRDEAIVRHWNHLCAAIGATPEETEAGLAQVLAQVARCRASPSIQTILAAPGLVEVPFRVRHEQVVLYGRIDRLWQDGDQHVVVDWKTGAPPPSRDPTGHRLQLLAYCWAADRILAESGAGRVRTALLFFTSVADAIRLDFGDADFASFPEVLERAAATVAALRAPESPGPGLRS